MFKRVVVIIYFICVEQLQTSNGDTFQKTHDELDFEFLGNIRGKDWRVQTNVYGNGSTSRGREERYFLPFNPTLEAHRYSILWTNTTAMSVVHRSLPPPSPSVRNPVCYIFDDIILNL